MSATYSSARVVFLVQLGHLIRVRQFLIAHPAVRSLVASGVVRQSLQGWFEVELRDATTLVDFLAELVAMPCFWRVFSRVAPFHHDISSLESLYADPRLREPGHTFRVAVYPPSLRDEVGAALLASGAALSPTQATHVISAIALDTVPQRYVYDIIPENVLVLTEPTSTRSVICRAYYKLEELFQTQLRREAVELFASRPQAIDVGASPGGWTDYLRHRCSFVYAVDPGELHYSLMNAPNVCHMQLSIQKASPLLQAKAPFDLLLCDMNLSDQEAVALLLPLAAFLRPGAWLVFTLKYCGRGCKPESIELAVHRLIRALGGGDQSASDAAPVAPLFDRFQWFWLWANSERERTIVARRTLCEVPAELRIGAADDVDAAMAPRAVSTWSRDGGHEMALADALIHDAAE